MVDPIVSIVTPARVASHTLQRTFASVASQLFDRWEHIVVTYPSDLETERVARQGASRDPRIVVKSAPCETAAAARNAGVASARGQHVLFLDADDTIAPAHLTRMVRQAAATGADVVVSGYRRISSGGTVIQRRAEHTGPLDIDRILNGPPAALHSMLFRRQLLEKVGCFDAGLETNEDWDLCLKAVAADATFHGCPGESAEYWISPESLSSTGAAMIRDRWQVAQRAEKLRLAGKGSAEGKDLAQDRLNTALWTSAVAIARGRSTGGLAAMTGAGPLPAPASLSAGEGTAALVDGLMVGFGCKPSRIETHMAARWEALEACLAELADAFADPGLDEALLSGFELELARMASPGARRFIGKSLAIPAGLGLMRPLDVPADARQVILRLPLLRPRSMATAAFAPAVAQGRSAAALLARRAAAWLAERPRSRFAKLAWLRDRAIRAAILGRRKVRTRFQPEPQEEAPVDPVSTTNWDAIFTSENPWGYDRDYEQGKYERTLSLLAGKTIGRALELACAEGHFTEQLAKRVEHLTASDVSAKALERCEERCRARDLTNVDFLELDFFQKPIGEGWDLIVSSEVLYYMASRDDLARYARRVSEALADGGYFLHAHAYEVDDSRDRSGFDWGDQFAARTISRTFSDTPGLVLEAAIETELYRCELYRKRGAQDQAALPAQAVTQSIRSELDPALAADAVWNGALVTRGEAEAERHYRVPVLMYHSISSHGPDSLRPWRTTPEEFEHQLRFLRRRGYRSLSMEEWDTARARGTALSGRPVLITFDDGFADFAEQAWPILKRNGFDALAFVVSGAAGEASDWDRWHGPPAPLMDWECLASLADEGLAIGSHFHTHLPLDHLTSAEIERQARLSREIIASKTGTVPTTIAPPFGICQPRHAEILRRAGFERVFLAEGDQAPLFGPRLRTPRIEVPGGLPISHFAELVGATEPAEAADLP
ncbi:trifunctional glycosyltransferase/class I SAM-dependent methyltransferase/polysaccharide deacetylase [Novosphingobium beihaiensis]|uniref:Chitooligosaccharide deacetylase n=1 Tax=Novosphingobium beihaiensis TaxID=2930389 RepID=A0ABT0BTJ0_9SPHN|nr:trifunctional glycosyltransferase/class I SAM-dependent methyltransferase/polysaccharide deacetylase [Novosphingobium beihaiensis]MCJ2188376.1 glycosyltransferase [Novosphingobium beihaiensis]